MSNGAKRPRDLRQLLPGISQKMLTAQLRQLLADDLILREAFAEVPPRVEYRLGEEGRRLLPVLHALCAWGKDYDSRHAQVVVPCVGEK